MDFSIESNNNYNNNNTTEQDLPVWEVATNEASNQDPYKE